MNKDNLKKFAYTALIASSMLAPFLVFAALGAPVPPIGGTGVTLSEVQDRITQIAQFLIIAGVVLAVIFIIWGGVSYMFAGGEETATTAAKGRIKNGIIGAAVVLAVGVILQTLSGLITRSFFG